MAQSVFENRFLADACHNVWEIWDKGRAYRLNLAQMAHEAGGHCQDECLNTLWAACMRSAGFFLCRMHGTDAFGAKRRNIIC